MRISIITVCLNSRETIERTIQSVIRQQYDDLEYIIIDGGSTDGTVPIIEAYRDAISICISEPDEGIYDAMNKGLQRASGDVVAFLNSDDWYVPEAEVFKRVREYFSGSDADIVSGNIYMFENGSRYIFPRNPITEENIFYDVVCPHPALFVKRELYGKWGGFDTSYKIAADTKWIINAWMKGADIVCVEDCFTYFGGGGISTTMRYEALQEHYAASLSCARNSCLKGIRKRIDDFFTVRLKAMQREKCMESALQDHPEETRALFDCQKGYYIWGAGIRGAECLSILEQLDIPVIGVIDSNPELKTLGSYNILKPEETDRRISVCITPVRYEEEIKARLRACGMDERQFFTYTDMLEKIVAAGAVYSGCVQNGEALQKE